MLMLISHLTGSGQNRRVGQRQAALLGGLLMSLGLANAHADDAVSEATSGLDPVHQINAAMRTTWSEWEITPSRLASEGEWCRRVHLDLIGRIASVNELRSFVNDDDPYKKSNLVDKLLYDEDYTEEYARNWMTVWTNILIGRSGGTENNSLTNREGMQKFLRDSFARNKPYDRLVYDLVTADGSNSPGLENFNGAVNFLATKVYAEDGTLATAATSRIFLGLQVQCTQCHNHPFNEWKQQKFWEMNAFFRQTRMLRRFVPGTRDLASAELVNEDFALAGSDAAEAEIYFEQRNGLLNVAYPVFVDGTALSDLYGEERGNSGYVDEMVRRTELGKLILKNDGEALQEASYLERMIVNRTWAHFMGYGFTKPVDDMGPHNAPTHPELVEYLGIEFRKASYDLKQLMTWIVLSEPYSLSSRVNKTNKTIDDPQLGESPKFSHFYLRQMDAEQLYESLIVATRAEKTRGSYEDQERAKTRWMQQFVTAFGNDEGEESTTFNGTIPQALMMMNGDLVKRATSGEKGSFLYKIAWSKMKPVEQINYLFEAGLGRKPTKNEIRLGNELIKARMSEQKEKRDVNTARIAALQDVWWVVLNRNEFIINH